VDLLNPTLIYGIIEKFELSKNQKFGDVANNFTKEKGVNSNGRRILKSFFPKNIARISGCLFCLLV
jgi:hypothetical protein